MADGWPRNTNIMISSNFCYIVVLSLLACFILISEVRLVDFLSNFPCKLKAHSIYWQNNQVNLLVFSWSCSETLTLSSCQLLTTRAILNVSSQAQYDDVRCKCVCPKEGNKTTKIPNVFVQTVEPKDWYVHFNLSLIKLMKVQCVTGKYTTH